MLWLPGHCISDSSCLCFDCPQRYCQRLLSFTRPDLYCWSKWGVILHMAVKTKNMILGPLQLVATSRKSSRSAVTLFTSLWKSVVLLIPTWSCNIYKARPNLFRCTYFESVQNSWIFRQSLSPWCCSLRLCCPSKCLWIIYNITEKGTARERFGARNPGMLVTLYASF